MAENTSPMPFSVSSSLLSIRLRTLSTHWNDCFSDVDFSDASNQSIIRSFTEEHTKKCTELQEKLIAAGETQQQTDQQTDTTTIPGPPPEPIRILGNVTPQELENLQRRKTIQASTRDQPDGKTPATRRSTVDTAYSHHHPSDEGDVVEDYTQYLDLHDDEEEESLLIDDSDIVWKRNARRNTDIGPRVVSLDPTRTSSRSHFTVEDNSTTTESLDRSSYQKGKESSVHDEHSTSSLSTLAALATTKEAPSNQSLLRRDSSTTRSGYEPGIESMLEYSSSVDDEATGCSNPTDVSETHCRDSDEESNPAPTVIARRHRPDDDESSTARRTVGERSKTSRTVLQDRALTTPKLSSKHPYPTSLIKENLMSPSQNGNNVSCLTNASFLSHGGPPLETVDEDDTLSVETPVLDRYRIELDDNSPHGFKVVPNPRGLHRRRRRQKPLSGTIREGTSPALSGYGRNGTMTSPRSSDSALLLYTQARMATARPPSVRSITPSEYHAAPRLIHLQTPLDDLNRAIATINTTIADQAKGHHSVIQHVHISENQALQMLGSQVLLRTLCQFGRLQVRDSSEERIFDVALDGGGP